MELLASHSSDVDTLHTMSKYDNCANTSSINCLLVIKNTLKKMVQNPKYNTLSKASRIKLIKLNIII